MADRQIQNEATLPESNKYVRLHGEVGRNVTYSEPRAAALVSIV